MLHIIRDLILLNGFDKLAKSNLIRVVGTLNRNAVSREAVLIDTRNYCSLGSKEEGFFDTLRFGALGEQVNKR